MTPQIYPEPTIDEVRPTLEKEEPKVGKKIPLMEMFGPTIQGEGAMIGIQTYFMRFGLCDYKCRLCDSMHAVDPLSVKQNAQYLTNKEILNQFLTLHAQTPGATRWVTLSGGNPCIHDLTELVKGLKFEGFLIAVETQGTFCPDWLQWCDQITVSPKGPGLGEKIEIEKLDNFVVACADTNLNLSVKVVVFDQRDLELVKELFQRYTHSEPDVGIRPQLLASDFFMSLGNPYPPDNANARHQNIDDNVMNELLIRQYKILFEDIRFDPILSQITFLPQLHVLVWGNARGK